MYLLLPVHAVSNFLNWGNPFSFLQVYGGKHAYSEK